MSNALPQYFDPRRLAAQGIRSAGTIDSAGMERLGESLAGSAPVDVTVELQVFEDEGGRVRVTGTVAATLQLTCQRCMEPAAIPVSGEFSLVPVATADEAEGVPDDAEPLILEKGPQVSLRELVEDELILALPVIARHEDIEECGSRARILAEIQQAATDEHVDEQETGGTVEHAQDEERKNPFDVLKKLKTDHSD